MMVTNSQRHHLRIDPITEAALEQVCRHTFQTKSALMRHYVQEGVKTDGIRYAQQVDVVRTATEKMAQNNSHIIFQPD